MTVETWHERVLTMLRSINQNLEGNLNLLTRDQMLYKLMITKIFIEKALEKAPTAEA
jgi:hypothetical protein